MRPSVLVAYASKHGSTREIAERIAEVLSAGGLEVDLQDVADVGEPTKYRAIVLGVAMYMGAWRKSAKQFLTGHVDALVDRDVWLFVSGPTGEGDAEEMMDGHAVQPAMEPVLERIHPREVAVFHGSIDLEALGWFERFVIRTVKAETGDFRDWGAIESWAAGIRDAIGVDEVDAGLSPA